MEPSPNTYEITYIINSVLNDKQTQDAIRRVEKAVEEIGGEIVETDEWGSRRLAYTINKRRNGYFVNHIFHAPGQGLARLERTLKIDDDILRYLVLRMDVHMLSHHEEKKRQASIQAQQDAEAQEEPQEDEA